MTIPTEIVAAMAGVFGAATCGLTAWISLTLIALNQKFDDLPCSRGADCQKMKPARGRILLRSILFVSVLFLLVFSVTLCSQIL